MPTTRSSARRTEGSSPALSTSTTGSKRKASESSPASGSKKGRRGAPKKQKTLEETLPDQKDTDMVTPQEVTPEREAEPVGGLKKQETDDEMQIEPSKEKAYTVGEAKGHAAGANGEHIAEASPAKPDEPKEEAPKEESGEKTDPPPKDNGKTIETSTEGDAVEKSPEREKSTPSSIMEKGIIYFFFRGRVGIDQPSDVNEIARSYIVLRPIPHGAKLGDGPMGDNGKVRVLALPKKVLPKGPKDRFMVFVDKANSNLEDIKQEFLSASDYATKTAGMRHTPPAAPIGEGVYAITSTGRESHLAYILTLPSEITEVQKDIGLQQRGSFVTSLKNPQHESPANAQLPQGPNFPKE